MDSAPDDDDDDDLVVSTPPTPSSPSPGGGEPGEVVAAVVWNSTAADAGVADDDFDDGDGVVILGNSTASAGEGAIEEEEEEDDEEEEDGTAAILPDPPTYGELAKEDEEISGQIAEVEGAISELEAKKKNGSDVAYAATIETEIEDLEAVEEELLEEALVGDENWIAINGYVYDVTGLFERHPAGPAGIEAFLHDDASRLFPRIPPAALPSYCVNPVKFENNEELQSKEPVCSAFTEEDVKNVLPCHDWVAGINATAKYMGQFKKGVQAHDAGQLINSAFTFWVSIHNRVYNVSPITSTTSGTSRRSRSRRTTRWRTSRRR